MKNNLIKISLILVVILAFLLRFYKVTEIPPSLNWDEVAIGYNAYSILKTGKDEWSEFLPLHFKSYGEYKLPAQIYASIPGIALFGLNELGVRITPVVYGTLTVLLLFFLGKALFKNDFIGLISAFLLAISPWHIQLTRASFESSFSVFWILLGISCFIKGFQNSRWFMISMIPFAISVYTYNGARVFTPLFLLTILAIYRKSLFKYKKAIYTALIIFIILIVPLIPFVLKYGTSRYRLVSITDEAGLVPRINENRGNSTLPQPLPRLVHNKFTYVTFYFTGNYLAHFSPQFLFIWGASHKQHHPQGIGQLYLFQVPFILLGLYLLFKSRNTFKGIMMSWLLIAFIPVSVTNDSIPNALRTIIANPFYQLITAFGIYNIYVTNREKSLVWKGILWGSVLVLTFWQFSVYITNYYTVYPKSYSRDWQYGYKQAVDYVKTHRENYDKIYFTSSWGQPYMFALFFMQYPPDKFQTDPNLARADTANFIEVSRFDKYYFQDLSKGRFENIASQNPNKRILFVGRSGDFPKEIPRLYSVDFLNGENAFDIVEVK